MAEKKTDIQKVKILIERKSGQVIEVGFPAYFENRQINRNCDLLDGKKLTKYEIRLDRNGYLARFEDADFELEVEGYTSEDDRLGYLCLKKVVK